MLCERGKEVNFFASCPLCLRLAVKTPAVLTTYWDFEVCVVYNFFSFFFFLIFFRKIIATAFWGCKRFTLCCWHIIRYIRDKFYFVLLHYIALSFFLFLRIQSIFNNIYFKVNEFYYAS